MFFLRVVPRLFHLLFWTLACYLAVSISLLFRRRNPGWQLRFRNRVFRAWARGFARAVRMRITVKGTPPTGPFFLVANHVSYLDIVLLANQIHGTFIAKADLRSWPVLGTAFAAADTIFVDRARRRDVLRVVERIEEEIARDLGVILFPEGTSGRGDAVLPFKPSLLNFASKTEYPVHFASLSYSTPGGCGPTHDLICWWGDAPFVPHILRLLRLPYFDAVLTFGETSVSSPDRKALASRLHQSITANFIPMD